MANYDFTYGQEVGTGKNESKKPHFPGGKSGVTLGPGYDMRYRSKESVKRDMMNAGIDEEKANKIAEGVNKHHTQARTWAKENSDLTITEEQQQKLFDNVTVPEYEAKAKRMVSRVAKENPELKDTKWEDLNDDQKALIFDYAYNPGDSDGKKFKAMTKAAMENDSESMEKNYKRWSGGEEIGRNKNLKDRFFKKQKSKANIPPPTQAASGASRGSSNVVNNIAPANLPQIPEVPTVPTLSDFPETDLSLPGFSVGFPAARLMDKHFCPMVTPGLPPVPHVGGPIQGPCVPTVIIGNMFAATVGDMCVCVGPPDSIIKGSTSVLIGGKPAARILDNCAHGGFIIQGCFTVLIGDAPSPITVMAMKAAAAGIGFLENCFK